MSEYSNKWESRPENVDCFVCRGDEYYVKPGDRDMIEPGKCCANTGLDEIPWAELFRNGRDRRNGGGL